MPRPARLATRYAPARLVSSTSAKASSLISASSVSRVTPALATSTSTGPWSASTAAKAASTEGPSRTSHRTTASPSTGSPEREVTVTLSPSAANRRAMASPLPPSRTERTRGTQASLSDGPPQTLFDADDTGLAVRVIVDGTWGFAPAVDLTADAAARAARQAVEVARVAAAMNTEPIELAPEPAYGDVTWVSDYDLDPFTVSVADKVEQLAQWSRDLLAHSAVRHADSSLP